MPDKSSVEQILKEQGLTEYKWINPKSIIVAQWVRMKCTFGCNGYGDGTCPPHAPSVAECERFFKEYSSGLIVRLSTQADKSSYPSDWSDNMTEKLLEAERQIFLSGYHKVFLLNQTCCTICKECSKSRIHCKDKRNARPSPESFAVDVFQTVRNAGFDIEVVSETPKEINRIAILLLE